MSSKGQVVIPEIIRKQMNLKPESRFAVTTGKDSVILKAIESRPEQDTGEYIFGASRLPQDNGLSEDAIEQVISGVRGQY